MVKNYRIVLGLQTSYVLSAAVNLKIIRMEFILISWDSKGKMKILVNPCFCTCQYDRKYTTELFDKSDHSPFHINCMSYLDSNFPSRNFYASIGSAILCIVRTITDLSNMVKCINLLFIRMKEQGSECICTILLFKNIFGKYFKVFYEL